MKLGILGTGKMVRSMLEAVRDIGFEECGIYGRDRNKAEALAEEFHLERVFSSFEELLRSDMDTVYVALPNALHYRCGKDVLESGKHVILEKPITVSLAELRELRKLSEEKDRILIEAMTVHQLPAYKILKEWSREIGKIRIAVLNYSQYSSRYDDFRKGIISPVFDPNMAGGALMDLNIYNIHAAVGLFGRPDSVEYHPNVVRNVDTSGILNLDYPEFKAVCIAAKDSFASPSVLIEGEDGMIQISDSVNQFRKLSMKTRAGEVREWSPENPQHRLYYEFREFLRIIEERDKKSADELMELSICAAEILDKVR